MEEATQFGNCNEADLEWDKNFKLDHLSDDVKGKLTELLNANKHIFATSVKELPGCDTFPHKIELTDDIPVRQKAYRVPYNLIPEMNKQIDVLLESGI
ncbi:hypothetical protein AVEN_48182-1 [Araneus ventricosus]|uniref:Uncharacterized protein n=1 Tax=Araneus ventricosus TaxID=182803 RepID=A0A4Y2J9C9_ARAVE|nr:hypothetical protein AVEN_48182-1 [Araneus ventricosus]